MSDAQQYSGSVTVSKDAQPKVVQSIYDEFASTYDKDIDPLSTYPALKSVIDTFLEVVGDSNKNIRIIDLGAGTGHAGLELQKHGFHNIDGLDLSPEMLKKAKEKNAYQKYICEAVTEKRLDIPTGTYDVVISVGSVTSGYIKPNAFDEILRLGKPGGYVLFTIRRDAFEEDTYEYSTKFQKFVEDGKWQEVKRFLSDYVVGFKGSVNPDTIRKCYVVMYKIMKNE